MTTLRVALLACCCLPLLSLTAGESSYRSRNRRGPAQVFQLGSRTHIGCVLLSEEEADQLGDGQDGSRLADRITNSRRRTTTVATRRPQSSRPRQSCPSGVTYFDGCNSCSCGTEQLCTLKACNDDTMVHIFDPCYGITCGYHQRCQAICVGQVCELRPLCVSDDTPVCHNCPWLCVDERLNCSDNYNAAACKPSLACYKPNV